MSGAKDSPSNPLVSHPVNFGQYHLYPDQRLLLRNGTPVDLGSRAFDVLAVLIAHAGDVISTRDLVRLVWRGVVVDESCLRVHISALRKALCCSDADVCYIANIPGRGYSFIASITHLPLSSAPDATASKCLIGELPLRSRRMVGRNDAVSELIALIEKQRFVTLIGSGGMGKTCVAIAVAHDLASHFEGQILFLDFSQIQDSRLLVGTINSALGVQCNGSDPTQALIEHLSGKHILLVLDSCEHVIEGTSFLAENLIGHTTRAHILVACREPLRADGEHTYRLGPLDCPSSLMGLSAAQALKFSAVHLFVERVTQSDDLFALTDSNAPVVSHICRKLDGLALAIELAASQVAAYGLHKIADLLNDRFSLFWEGKRTALSRHQTLHALLDWSYVLLSATEASVLRRLSVLNGKFSLELAAQVASSPMDETMVIDALGRLVTKSLVLAEIVDQTMHYRLPYTTKAYALEKLSSNGEHEIAIERHANFLIARLERLYVPEEALPEHERIHRYIDELGNICTTLEWAFSKRDKLMIGIRLAAASAPLFLGLSLLDECRRWSLRALAAGGYEVESVSQKMGWQNSLFFSSIPTGKLEALRSSRSQSLIFDERRKSSLSPLRSFGDLITAHTKTGQDGEFREITSHGSSFNARITDPKEIAIIHWMAGSDCGLEGRLFSAGLGPASVEGASDLSLAHDYRIRALSSLARVLWLRGYPDQAAEIGREALERADRQRHPQTLCLSLIYVSTVFLWIGDWRAAEHSITKLTSTAMHHSIEPDHAVGLGLKGILLCGLGDVDAGMPLLRECLNVLSIENHQVLAPMFIRCLAEAFAATGEFDTALEILTGVLEMIENVGESFDTPEILRIVADLHATRPRPDLALAEQYLCRSLSCAGRQSSLAWELRAATSLARLRLMQGRRAEAGELLQSVYGRFTEGYDSTDLREAMRLLNSLH
ncbi:winged helix-turn-helix domain-containing protein [Pseudomonas gregormendelii]|uniref:Winged helix-turn-helix domain-containing protein n=1 Tax=Pseudomonas gregormendelii TaxID=1628277 RepID=A0ABS3ANG5_9PSED|nr:winged helix-turn-helix domain-containing protein [Pseudomonas gregormendelii]MBN3968723.1 winged helix-turn-helix domain-containing protein [Pseudomonas gregormendelii]